MEEPPDDALLTEVGDPALPPSARNTPEAQAAKLQMLRGLLDDGGAVPAAPARRGPTPESEPESAPESEPESEEAAVAPGGGTAGARGRGGGDGGGDRGGRARADVGDADGGGTPAARPVTAATPGTSLREEAEAALRELVGREDARLREDQ